MTKTFRLYLPTIMLLIILSQNLFASKIDNLDSLKSILSEMQNDSIKLNILNQISWQYLQRNLDSAEKYNAIFNEHAIKIKDLRNQAIGLNTSCVVQWYKGDMDAALKYIKKALIINLQRQDTSFLSGNYGNIGMLYDNLGQTDSAIYYYKKALTLAIVSNNLIGQAKSHANIAILFTDVKDFQLALKHNFEAEKIYLKIGNISDLPILYNNIGIIYKIQMVSDSARFYYSKGLLIADSLGLVFSQAKLMQDLGNLFVQDSQYISAMKYFKSSLKKSNTLGNIYLITDNYLSIGELHHKQNEPAKAIPYFEKSLENAMILENLHIMQASFQMLFENYKKTGDYKNAMIYLEQYTQIRDSLTKEKFRNELAEFDVAYETEKKEHELIEQKAIIQLRGRTILTTKIIIVFTFIGIIIILWLYLLKRKALKKLVEKNIELSSCRRKTKQESTEKDILLFNQLVDSLNNEKHYLKPNLKIDGLAKTLNTNRTELSNAINSIAKKQFNNFINGYRIDEAIKHIDDNNGERHLIKVLAPKVGFKSHSVFYRCFKENTGVTPAHFIKYNRHK